MLREIVHFVKHAPASIRLMKQLSHVELYDVLMSRCDDAGLDGYRTRLCEGLGGSVLEVGCGTGAQFPHYASDARVTAVEIDDDFRALAAQSATSAAADIEVTAGDAQSLAFPDNHFDAVVIALVLCSVPSVDKVARELRRVLAPGGKLRLIEHIRSERPVSGALMAALNPAWLALNRQGCNMHRNPTQRLLDAGFTIDRLEHFQLFADGLPAFPQLFIEASLPG